MGTGFSREVGHFPREVSGRPREEFGRTLAAQLVEGGVESFVRKAG
jgi:hypothetical protein